MSDWQIPNDSGFSSCPNNSTRTPELSVAHRLLGQRQHPARPRRRIVDGPDDPAARQRLVVGPAQIDDQADHLARREVLAGRLVRDLGEAPDQVLEQVAHLQVRDRVGMEVDLGEPIEDLPEETAVVQPLQDSVNRNLSRKMSRTFAEKP